MKKKILLIIVCVLMFLAGSIFIFFKYDYKKTNRPREILSDGLTF